MIIRVGRKKQTLLPNSVGLLVITEAITYVGKKHVGWRKYKKSKTIFVLQGRQL